MIRLTTTTWTFPALGVPAAVLCLAAACADEPTRPRAATTSHPAQASRSLGLADDARGQLRAALLFARQQSVLSLRQQVEQQDASDRVAEAFATLATRVEADDAVGTERALAAARLAVNRYREAGSKDDAAAADLAAMDLTLERATALAAEAHVPPNEKSTRVSHNREQQP